MKKKSKINLIIIITVLLVAIGISTYAYYNAVITGTSRVNVLTKTASQAVISVGNNDSVTLTVLPEDMYEDNNGTYKESSGEEAGTLYATVSTGSANGQTCSVTIKYEPDEDYVFTRSHYCSKDGEANTYASTCAEGYTAHTSSEITDYPEYALYLEPVVSKGYLESDENVNTLVDISDINDDTETTVKTYTWKLPTGDLNGRIDVNVKARYYNLNFDQNSSADKTYTGNISMSVYCVGEVDILYQTVNRLHLSTADIIETVPDYTIEPTQSTSGLYKTSDDYGTSLVFHGRISNNWAKFGKESVLTNCTNSDSSKDIMSAIGEKITSQAICETTYNYNCSNDTTIFVGTTNSLEVCTTLGLSITNTNVTGTYHSAAVTIEKDIYWRGLRINGDGTLRLIYTGNFPPKSNPIVMPGAWTKIGTTAFNTEDGKNAYVGYMYGDPSGTTYEETHANTNVSTIKTYIDNWYNNKTNLGTTNDNIVADAYFCYDRSIYKGSSVNEDYSNSTGIGTTISAYGAAGRLTDKTKNISPILTCSQANDMYTKTSTSINNKITIETNSKIGLLSADEAVMVGVNSYFSYLYARSNFWLGSPGGLNSLGYADVFYVVYKSLNYGYVSNSNIGVRPVLSVDTTYLTTGNGTAQNPWVFEITNS